MAAGRGAAGDASEVDRDSVDFEPVIRFLRRLGVLRPPRPEHPGMSEQQLTLFGSPPAPAPTAAAGSAPSGGPELDAEVADDAPITRDVRARMFVAAVVVLYVGIFASWTMRHHDGMGTQAFDLGLYDQGVWLLSRFKEPFVTLMGRNLFGDHTSFILLPLVPLYWIWPTAKVLLFAQAAAIGISAVPVFLLAREKLRNELLASVLAGAFLLQPVLGWMNLEQFHPDLLAIPFALFAAYFMVKARWVPFLLCIGAILLVKEDTFLLTLGFGVYVAIKHDRRVGLLTCAISVVYASLAFWVVLPALNGVGTLNSWRIPFGGPFGLLKTSILHPGEVASYLFVEDRTWYVWQLLAPVACVALLGGWALLIGLGPLASNLFSTFLYQYDIHYHYSALVAPMIMVAAIFGVARYGRTMFDRRNLVMSVALAALVTAHLWGPTPLGRNEFTPADPDAPQAKSVRQAIDLIPDNAVLSAYYGWVPQVDHRERIYMFPNPWKASYWGTFKQEGKPLPFADDVDWVLLPVSLDPEPRAVYDSIRSQFETVHEKDGVRLLRRLPEG